MIAVLGVTAMAVTVGPVGGGGVVPEEEPPPPHAARKKLTVVAKDNAVYRPEIFMELSSFSLSRWLFSQRPARCC
jgi:hypothetical protein